MPKVFRSIARLIYYSNGGFSFQELYGGMPVYVRRYMIGEIEDIKQSEKEAMEGGGSSGGSGPGEKASSEDIGRAMEELQKRSGEEQADEDVLKQVFGDEEERDRKEPDRQQPKRRKPPQKNQPRRAEREQQRRQQQQNPERRQEQEPKKQEEQQQKEQADPAKAEDLEQMLDKLQSDM